MKRNPNEKNFTHELMGAQIQVVATLDSDVKKCIVSEAYWLNKADHLEEHPHLTTMELAALRNDLIEKGTLKYQWNKMQSLKPVSDVVFP